MAAQSVDEAVARAQYKVRGLTGSPVTRGDRVEELHAQQRRDIGWDDSDEREDGL